MQLLQGFILGHSASVPLLLAGFTADLLLLGVMATLWLVAAYYRGVMQRLDPEERLRVVWRPWPALVSVVTAHPHIDDSTIVPGWMSPAALHPSSANSSTTSTAPWTVQDLLVLEVEFRHLGLRMRTGTHRQILSDVSAKFQGARLTAILGPSGAGKSTLLCLLAGRMHRARVEVAGEVLVNGRRDRLERYSHVLGFVPQDDIMHSTLTVEENLMFSARYRLPRECTAAERRRRVDGTLHALGLAGVRRELVGDQAVRGISGGQVRMHLCLSGWVATAHEKSP